MISSYPPRLCGIATFCEEAREFVRKRHQDRQVLVVSHTDGEGDGVFPLIDMERRDWWRIVAAKVRQLQPYAIHIEHEYGLYEYRDPRGHGDGNQGFLDLLDAINDFPIVVEPHTVHGRLSEFEADFLFKLCQRAHVVIFKCHYQKWRLDWNFHGRGWPTPRNVMVIPHGSRPDKRWTVREVVALRQELDFDNIPYLSKHIVGPIGWIQSNKRWDILTTMWEEIVQTIKAKTGVEWDLLAAGSMRDPADKADYEKYKQEVALLEQKGLAHYYEFVPRGDRYYKMMALCDFIVLPSTDETQSGTLARIIALNKPFITTAPMEGLTAQTLESQGGLLFTTKDMLRRHVIELACDEGLRMRLGNNLKQYLENVVSWDIVSEQYDQAYDEARVACRTKQAVVLPLEF